MSKKVKSKVKQFLINIVMIGVFFLATYLLFQVSVEIVATIQLRSQLNQVSEQLENIEKEYEYLVEQKEKLLDPEYVKNYARSGFMLSKEGEQIFFLPQAEGNE